MDITENTVQEMTTQEKEINDNGDSAATRPFHAKT